MGTLAGRDPTPGEGHGALGLIERRGDSGLQQAWLRPDCPIDQAPEVLQPRLANHGLHPQPPIQPGKIEQQLAFVAVIGAMKELLGVGVEGALGGDARFNDQGIGQQIGRKAITGTSLYQHTR